MNDKLYCKTVVDKVLSNNIVENNDNTVTVTGTPYTVLGSFSANFTCCAFSVFTFRSIRIVEVLQIRA